MTQLNLVPRAIRLKKRGLSLRDELNDTIRCSRARGGPRFSIGTAEL